MPQSVSTLAAVDTLGPNFSQCNISMKRFAFEEANTSGGCMNFIRQDAAGSLESVVRRVRLAAASRRDTFRS
jgi:hypothetical protein